MAIRKAGLDQVRVDGRRVLVRVDFNVPLDDGGQIRDDRRIRLSLPTIRELSQKGARVILATHLGRPKGQPRPELSTEVLALRLEELLQQPVLWAPECVGDEVVAMSRALQPGEILLLQNLRFHPGEEANDSGFAEELARLGDLYVDDAFGTAHRAHASTEGVTHFLPSYCGRLMARELEELSSLLENPDRPLLALIGGSKLSTKLGILRHLIPGLDQLCLGGAMCSTFLKAQGLEVGASLVEDSFLPEARTLEQLAADHHTVLELPSDVVVACGPDASEAEACLRPVDQIRPGEMILDVGEQTLGHWSSLIAKAATIVWNGPLGLYENPVFAKGTRRVAEAIAASPGRSVTGGGDLQAALQELGLEQNFTHVSTGGGATLEFLEGKQLPGVAALMDADQAGPGN